jgi:cation diffusion facilitator family transporter
MAIGMTSDRIAHPTLAVVFPSNDGTQTCDIQAASQSGSPAADYGCGWVIRGDADALRKSPGAGYMTTMTAAPSNHSEKQSVALVSLVASAGLASVKLLAAVLTGSLGLLSEAIHSLIDFGATVITWFAIRWADRPADEDHHYGHAKIESVAALVETGLLFVTSAWVVVEAIKRLLGEAVTISVPWWAIVLLVLSMLIDYNRSNALQRVADTAHSHALAADALHFRADMWSSGFVLIGLGFVSLGFQKADAIAGLVVAGFVGYAAWQLGKRTLATLIDTAPEGATADIRHIAEATPGVLKIKLLRVRPAGPTIFVNLIVEVARTMAVDDMVRLRTDVQSKISQRFTMADIVVATEPIALDSETIFEKINLIASRCNANIHHLTVQDISGRLAISFDIEFDGQTPLDRAHTEATSLENAIRAELGEDIEVESHIEPQPLRSLAGVPAALHTEKPIAAALQKLASRHKAISDIHNIRVRHADGGLFVHYHCRFMGSASVVSVHDVVDKIENDLVEKFPTIHRVIAHAEPVGHAHHKL